ncbi:hypothetical protein A9Q74_09235 [Colwellia sp. 39_35_sub15_T18]|nr:hypothetical protein A9Q74_09235 [Colwellia sp. 39_35_sub15_T18]
MIKKITTLVLMVTAQFLLTSPAYAAKTLVECQQADLTMNEASSCLDGVTKAIDRELQTWVNNHVFNLEEKALITGRYSALKMFKRSQSNFITFRDNDCRWRYLMVSPEKGANVAYKKCYIQLSQLRIKELSQVN